ncbi:MAG: transposase [Chloroflexi bacterium]|nr:transposase [Chloroflexota bacterium]
METEWIIDRQHLRDLLREMPALTYTEMAVQVGHSLSWIKKWVPRLRIDLHDDRLRERRRSPRRYGQPSRSPQVVAKILAIRDEPPDHLRRTPGPRAILYYLAHDPDLQQTGVRLPRSTRTIWQVLVDYQRIPCPIQAPHEPLPLVNPMQHWQFDFKDATTAQDDTTDKQAHQVEILNIVDAGTSLVVDHHVRVDFNAETAIQALATTFTWQGLPQSLTFDRDPRFVGAQQSRDFPSALMRFLYCLGIQPIVCPPHRPDKNAYVERYHRSLKAEALQVERPATLEATQHCVDAYRWHYNHERPNQVRGCGNQPPSVAFPSLPTLPSLPDTVDPDAWLTHIDGRLFRRRIMASGTVHVALHDYYVRQKLHGQVVLLKVNAPARTLEVWWDGQLIKHLPIQGLYGKTLPLQDYFRLITQEAVSEARRLSSRISLRSTNWDKSFGSRS